MNVFKWIWEYIKPYKLLALFGFTMVLAVTGLNMVTPYLSGMIVDDVILGGRTEILINIIAIMAGATLLKSIIRYCFQLAFETISQGCTYKIREDLYSHIQRLDFNFFDKTRTGDIMARMTGDLEAVRHFTAAVVYSTFENLTVFITVVIIIFTVNWQFTLILLAIAPATAYFAYRLANDVKPTFSAIREQFSRLNSVVQENISGNRVVKAFAKEDYEIEKFTKENQEFMQKNLASAKVWEKYFPVLDSLAASMSVILILVGGIMVINKWLTLGELVIFNSILWALNNPLRMMGWLINDIQRFVASADKIILLLRTRPQIKTKECFVQKDTINGTVEFCDVSFSYADEKVLQKISFKANPGETVAVIGPTGSGKSTLVNLICRFYDPTEGTVLIDDIDIREMDVKKLRSRIGVAMQDIFLFSDTIEGNIAYGIPDAPVDRVNWAAEMAGAHRFIEGFAEGYDTIVGERGVGLSGGQKQRIALARALLKNPSILILDDTTSSVDIETEHEIHSQLKSFYKNKTTFVIAHRISTVKNADLILVLDNGRVVETGKHADLLALKGHYYSVFVNQFGDFDSKKFLEVV